LGFPADEVSITVWLSFLLGGSTPGVFSAFFISSIQTNVSVWDQMAVGGMGELVLGASDLFMLMLFSDMRFKMQGLHK
jgi:hypothetical protein